MAREVCLRKCYLIREYLVPIFGPEFVANCTPEAPEEASGKRRPGRRRKSPPVVAKRSSKEMLNDEGDPTINAEAVSTKRVRRIKVSTPRYSTPVSTAGIDVDPSTPLSQPPDWDPVDTEAALCLVNLRYGPFDRAPQNDEPITESSYQGGRHRGNDNTEWVDMTLTPFFPMSPLPSFKDIVASGPMPQRYNHFPITPSPQNSPNPAPSMNWSTPSASAAGPSLISPPLTVRENFMEYPCERRPSNSTEECRTPIQEDFRGPLFYP
jgi:hypothetical protein